MKWSGTAGGNSAFSSLTMRRKAFFFPSSREEGGFKHEKYTKIQAVSHDRSTGPTVAESHHQEAPQWCSVDLRDGNQALEIPMTLEQKLVYYNKLLEIGFKTIEIGFPAASDTEYEFTRYLIDNHLIPDDVYIQVLTQSRRYY